MPKPKPIIFTDLDGTLLDSEYSFESAKEAISLIKKQDIPVVFCTSKTFQETLKYCKSTGFNHPLIVESGGAVYLPQDYFEFEHDFDRIWGAYKVIVLGCSLAELKKCVDDMKEKVSVEVLSEMDSNTISRLTNLPKEDADLIKKHKHEWALIFKESDESLVREITESYGLNLTKGRFFFVKKGNKGIAVRKLTSFFKKKYGNIKTYAIGNTVNDSSMLDAVDRAFIVKNINDGYFSDKYEKLDGVGPEGWQKGINEILKACVNNSVTDTLKKGIMSDDEENKN